MFNTSFSNNRYSPKATPFVPSSGFRYFEMEENSLYKLEGADYIHLLYLLEGELLLSESEHQKPVVKQEQLLFIPNTKTAILATKNSKFVLFSISEYHCKIEPIFNTQIAAILAGVHKQKKPLNPPKVLKAFFQEITLIWKDKLNIQHIQEIKKKELFIILEILYLEGSRYEESQQNWHFGNLSLS